MQKDRELRKVPRACQSTGRAGEAEWTLQEPEAIGAELVRQTSLLGTGTFGVLDTLRQLRSKGSSLLRPSAIRAGERGRQLSSTASNAPYRHSDERSGASAGTGMARACFIQNRSMVTTLAGSEYPYSGDDCS